MSVLESNNVDAVTVLTNSGPPKSAASGTARKTLRQQIWRYRFCYLAMIPTFALLGVFVFYPAVSVFYYAFTNWDGFTSPQWIGFANFAEIFQSDVFQHGWVNLLVLTISPIIQVLTVPVLVAELIFGLRSQRLGNLFRTFFILPFVVPLTVTFMLWQFFYDPNVGLINTFLNWLGIQSPPLWLGSPSTSLISLLGIGFPWVNGVAVLIYLAGLIAIPGEILDAAKLDGAVGWTRFRTVDLPLIMGQVKLMVILTTIAALQNFGYQLFLTSGGPANSTTVPAYEMYEAAFRDSRFGLASAVGVFLFLIIFILTVINNRFIRSSVEYQATN